MLLHRPITKKMVTRKAQGVTEIRKGREAAAKVVALEKDVTPKDVWLMTNVQPISRLPKWAQWMVRFIYFRYGWAAMAQRDGMYYSVEYRGVTPDEAEARYLSSEVNASYTQVSWRSCLPMETCQYGTHDFPHSEVSAEYRSRALPFDTVPRTEMERLREKIRATDGIVERFRTKTA